MNGPSPRQHGGCFTWEHIYDWSYCHRRTIDDCQLRQFAEKNDVIIEIAGEPFLGAG
jgi:hypothetical protein